MGGSLSTPSFHEVNHCHTRSLGDHSTREGSAGMLLIMRSDPHGIAADQSSFSTELGRLFSKPKLTLTDWYVCEVCEIAVCN